MSAHRTQFSPAFMRLHSSGDVHDTRLDAGHETPRIFGYAEDAFAANDCVDLIADQRQQLRAVAAVVGRIDNGIYHPTPVISQRRVRRREQESIFANEAL